MDDDRLTQRIKYLTEHGGLLDDPLADIRQSIKRLQIGTGALVLASLVVDALLLLR